MIKKVWTVFVLDEAVSGINNSGIVYDDRAFTALYQKSFDTEEDAHQYIEAEMKRYEAMNTHRGIRFVFLPVFVYDDDPVFVV